MFSKNMINKYMINYSNQIASLKQKIDMADSILIGAGVWLSTSAGHFYDGKRFLYNFSDFHNKYGINDMYSGGFYPFESLE